MRKAVIGWQSVKGHPAGFVFRSGCDFPTDISIHWHVNVICFTAYTAFSSGLAIYAKGLLFPEHEVTKAKNDQFVVFDRCPK